jgi:hypothetical protein
VAHITLNDREDKFRWGLHQNGVYSINSMYRALISDNRVRYDMTLWKLKIPLHIKIFMWYVKRGVVLTKDNLITHNWKGCKLCAFCIKPESIQHIFLDCHLAKFLWRVVPVTFNIDFATSVEHMFNGWANSVGFQLKKFLLTEGFNSLLGIVDK